MELNANYNFINATTNRAFKSAAELSPHRLVSNRRHL
jgi:hypothetical protein